jgi:hypothetical protein
MKDLHSLKFRRQFLFSDCPLSEKKEWKKYIFENHGKNWNLIYHPDLNVEIKEYQDRKMILLGYVLDPLNPELTNIDILEELIQKKDIYDLLTHTNHLNGRFVMIYLDRDNIYLFHDATGFREVFYHFADAVTLIGSTPNFLAEWLNIKITSDENVLGFYHSEKFKKNFNIWTGYNTLYDQVYRLQPNYCIDLLQKRLFRYWPTKKIHALDVDTAAEKIAEILKGTIAGAVKRFEVHMGLTAGWDTRLLLAASRNFKNDIFYYVNKTEGMRQSHKDVRIPLKLSRKLNFRLNILNIDHNVPENFKEIYFENNIMAEKKLLDVFHNVYKNNWENTVTISGTMGNGLARIYMPVPQDVKLNGRLIANIIHYNGLPYAETQLTNWCNEVLPVCEENHINIMDLYQWEQENANWASLTASEQDIVRDEIRPFNNRALIELFWSIDDDYRYQYYPEIYIKIMRILWEDVLKTPINPSYRSCIYKILRILGIEKMIYSIYKNKMLQSSIPE